MIRPPSKLNRSEPQRFSKRRGAALFALGIVLLCASPRGQAQQAAPNTDALPFAKSYLLTGNYIVGGVDLQPDSKATSVSGTIPMSGVPANADILAAFVY